MIVQGGIRIRWEKVFHPVLTKKKLREMVKDYPERLQFYTTSDMGDQFAGPIDKLGDDTTLIIVGPDPYNNRVWYANIERTPKGLRVT